MSRGRRPLVALSEAVHLAKKRGEVRQFMYEPGMICNFVIYCPGFTAHVRIKRISRVHCSLMWIEGEARDALTELRAIAPGTGISRELWVFLPRGAFRFFRVTETGLVELNRDRTVMPEKTRAAVGAKPSAIPPVQAPPPELSVGETIQEKGRTP